MSYSVFKDYADLVKARPGEGLVTPDGRYLLVANSAGKLFCYTTRHDNLLDKSEEELNDIICELLA